MMGWRDWLGLETRGSVENPAIPVSSENFLAFFGVQSGNLPNVTIDSALAVPAVSAAVTFLSSSLANLPLHVYRANNEGSERAGGPLQRILNEAPNSEWTSFGLRKYLWTQVFTGGRGMAWVERAGNQVVGIWPINPSNVTVKLENGKRIYTLDDKKTYAAADIIDIPFLLKRDQLSSYSPIVMGAKAIQLALAMNDYGSNFFAGGGVPPLSLSGPLPQGAEAMKRAMGDINRAIEAAKASDKPIFPMPPGHELKQVGFDPAKGQMVEARLFQIQEIARIYNIPPVFLQDLSRGTFANVEQQDLHLIKHLIAQWAKAFEDELNLKLFGAARNKRYVEHSMDGLMRGDFASRMNGHAQAIQNALRTPNEARALENLPPKENGDNLYVQGATVPLGSNVDDAAGSEGDVDDTGN